MWTTITPAAMKALEADYMQRTGVPSALLMEHAAMAVCDALARHVPPRGTVLFLCGPGNNGGDGWAAARIWQQRGGRSAVISTADRLTGDAQMNRDLACRLGVPVLPGDAWPECDGICDALFGTGLSRPPEGDALALIRRANACGKPIVAVDIPSGLDGTAGMPLGEAIRAT